MALTWPVAYLLLTSQTSRPMPPPSFCSACLSGLPLTFRTPQMCVVCTCVCVHVCVCARRPFALAVSFAGNFSQGLCTSTLMPPIGLCLNVTCLVRSSVWERIFLFDLLLNCQLLQHSRNKYLLNRLSKKGEGYLWCLGI